MTIDIRKQSEIKPLEHDLHLNNPTVHLLGSSLQEFGFRQPIVVDEHGVIVAGHTRLEATGKCGLDEVPICATFGPEVKRP